MAIREIRDDDAYPIYFFIWLFFRKKIQHILLIKHVYYVIGVNYLHRYVCCAAGMMRITYLHQYFNTPSMPGGTRSYEMARRLVDMGHEVNMVTSWREPDGRKDWFTTDEAGIQVHWLPVQYSNHMTHNQRIASFLKFAWGGARKATSIPADVLFATSTPLTIALPGVYAARRQKVPMVFEVRDLWPEVPIAMGALRNPFIRSAAFKLENFAYKNSSELVALSPAMAAGIASSGIPAKRITMIPNSCDVDVFYPDERLRRNFRTTHGINEDKILFVYTGTFGRVNQVSYLVYLSKALEDDQRFHFLTIGDGVDYSDVHQLANDLGVLNKNMTMLGRIPKAEMTSVLAAADIASSFVAPIPELEGNSANKFFDGLAAGCCFVVNHGGWQADILKETGAGLRLERDVVVAASQLQEIADHPERIVQAKLAARQLAKERFSRDKLAAQLEQVLLRAVANHLNCDNKRK